MNMPSSRRTCGITCTCMCRCYSQSAIRLRTRSRALTACISEVVEPCHSNKAGSASPSGSYLGECHWLKHMTYTDAEACLVDSGDREAASLAAASAECGIAAVLHVSQ